MRRLYQLLKTLVLRKKYEQDLQDELNAHLAMDTFERIGQGDLPTEARHGAARDFGSMITAVEDTRQSWGWTFLDQCGQDLRYALRQMRHYPAFTCIVVLTLAIGIGADTAIFSVVNAVLIRPLPYEKSDRLVKLVKTTRAQEGRGGAAPDVGLLDVHLLGTLRSRAQSLLQAGVYVNTTGTMSGPEGTVRLNGMRLSPEIFPMLGIRPLFGRYLQTGGTEGAEPEIVLSYGLWQRQFGGEPAVAGMHTTLNGISYVVVAVMPPGFQFPDPHTEFWTRFAPLPQGYPMVQAPPIIARLKDGVSIEAASSEVNAIGQSLVKTDNDHPVRFAVVRIKDGVVAPVSRALVVLAVSVGFVLLIACVNVANLMLARISARQGEIAVRLALGASRARLLRQFVIESLLLSCAGGAIGAVLAFGGVRLLRILSETLARRDLGVGVTIPRFDEIHVDLPSLALTMAICLAAGFIFGWMSALRQSVSVSIEGLRFRGKSSISHAFVIAEVGLAVMLLIGAGLMIRSFSKLSSVDPGYDPEHVLTFQVSLPAAGIRVFGEDFVARVQSLPGVTSAGYALQLPMVLNRLTSPIGMTPDIWEPGKLPPPPEGPGLNPPQWPDTHYVSRNFMTAMGMRLIQGRGFGTTQPSAGRTLLINQSLARSGLLGRSPVGKLVYAQGDRPWEVIGIVADVRQFGLDQEPGPQIFFDLQKAPVPPSPDGAGPYFAIRTTAKTERLAPAIRELIREVDPHVAMDNVATMQQLVSNSIARSRLYTVLLSIFAAVAVSLAAIGIYGVIVFAVGQRTQEIGIRVALGAQPLQIMKLILGQCLLLIGIGLALGTVGATATTRFLAGMLFELSPLDVFTFLQFQLLFCAIAALACYLPARRAMRVDPLVAIRQR